MIGYWYNHDPNPKMNEWNVYMQIGNGGFDLLVFYKAQTNLVKAYAC